MVELTTESRYDEPRRENTELLDGQAYSIFDDSSVLDTRHNASLGDSYVLFGHDGAEDFAPKSAATPFVATKAYFTWYRSVLPPNVDVELRNLDFQINRTRLAMEKMAESIENYKRWIVSYKDAKKGDGGGYEMRQQGLRTMPLLEQHLKEEVPRLNALLMRRASLAASVAAVPQL